MCFHYDYTFIYTYKPSVIYMDANKFTTFLFMGRFPKKKCQNKQNYAYLYAM